MSKDPFNGEGRTDEDESAGVPYDLKLTMLLSGGKRPLDAGVVEISMLYSVTDHKLRVGVHNTTPDGVASEPDEIIGNPSHQTAAILELMGFMGASLIKTIKVAQRNIPL